MTTPEPSDAIDGPVQERAAAIFAENEHRLHCRTDRLFAALMSVQWIAGIMFALWVSPLATRSAGGSCAAATK